MEIFKKNGYIKLFKPWIIWFICSLFYSHQYFSRVSVQTYAETWATQFLLSPLQLSFLAASFMYIYLFMQPVTGILINRFGLRPILILSVLVATLGCFVQAFSSSYYELLLARILLGLGGAFALVSIINICNVSFNKKQFTIANSLTFTVGGFGALVAGTPLALLISQTGWRIAAISAGVFSLFVSIVLVFLIKHHPYSSTPLGHLHSWKSTRKIFLKTTSTWLLWGPSLYSAFLFLPMSVLSSLWLEPFLITEYHQNSVLLALTSSIQFAGYIIGAPMLALLFNKTKDKQLLLSANSLVLTALCLFIIYDNHIGLVYLSLIIFAFGFLSSAALLSIPIIRDSLPSSELTIGFSIATFFLNFAGVLFLPIIGWSLEYYDHLTDSLIPADFLTFSLASYHHAFFFLPLSTIIAFLISLTLKTSHLR